VRAVIFARHTAAAIGALVVFCGTSVLQASPIADLSSPSQEKRDAAAKILRATYVPASRTNWDLLVSSLQVGSPKTKILAQLQSLNLRIGGGVGSGNTEIETYPLDEFWSLECSFTNTVSGSGLARVGLTSGMSNIWVEPPTNFTGIWTTYYANGEQSDRIQYKGGRYNGEFIAFYSDGSRSVVSHHTNGVSEGEEVGFFPSGRVKHKGNYHAGAQVGKWIWYREDGSIESQRDYGVKGEGAP
jgi:hypothetical protein